MKMNRTGTANWKLWTIGVWIYTAGRKLRVGWLINLGLRIKDRAWRFRVVD